ncbi:hypothetical protein SLA2020_387670 [Shorea laevis]
MKWWKKIKDALKDYWENMDPMLLDKYDELVRTGIVSPLFAARPVPFFLDSRYWKPRREEKKRREEAAADAAASSKQIDHPN